MCRVRSAKRTLLLTMSAKIKHKGLRRNFERRTVNVLSRHSRTLFMFIVAFSSVALYMTSRMLRHSHNRMEAYERVGNGKIILGNQGKLKKVINRNRNKQIDVKKQSLVTYRTKINEVNVLSLNKEPPLRPLAANGGLSDNSPNENLKEDLELLNFCQRSSIFLLVLIFSEEPKSSLRNLIRKTWCQRQMYSSKRRMMCLFMIGQRSFREEFSESSSKEATEKGDVLLMSLHDNVRNSTLKLITGMQWVTTNCPNVKFILRTEDDVIINMFDLMENILPQVSQSEFVGGRLISELPVRNILSNYYVSFKDYPFDSYPPLFNNMGYILSDDVLRKVFQAVSRNNLIPLDNIFVGVLLDSLKIPVMNMSTLVYGKAFQLNSDPIHVICDYAIIHLHGNSEGDAIKVWSTMRSNCNNHDRLF